MTPSRPARTLLSLPQDVLQEILAYVLTDVSDPGRAAVLCASRALHDAAGSLLYRTAHARSLANWKALLEDSESSLLTVEGGRALGKHVKELRLSTEVEDFENDYYTETPFSIGIVDLPGLLTLAIEPKVFLRLRRPLLLRPLFAQLRPTTLRLFANNPLEDPFAAYYFSTTEGQDMFDKSISDMPYQEFIGLPESAWDSLRTIHFDGVAPLLVTNPTRPLNELPQCMLPLSHWTVETVVFSPQSVPARDEVTVLDGARTVCQALFGFPSHDGVPSKAGKGAYAGWGKVELRVGDDVEKVIRKLWREWEARVTAKDERRLMEVTVIIGDDGVERQLVEQKET